MVSGSTHFSNYDQETPLDEDSSSSENSTGKNRARPKGLTQAIASRVAEHERRSKGNQDRRHIHPDGVTPSSSRLISVSRPITRSIASQSVPKSQAAGVKRRRKVSSSKSGNASSASAKAPSMDSCPSTGMFPPDTFKSDAHHKLWSTVLHRIFYSERLIRPRSVKGLQILELLAEVGLTKTSLALPSFVKQVVLEFFCNLSKDISEPTAADHFLAFVRGELFSFSPIEINRYLGFSPPSAPLPEFDLDDIVLELTGGVLKSWPDSGCVRASVLTYKYSILHKIAIHNWIPTKHRSDVREDLADLLYRIGSKSAFDIGQIIFDNVVRLAESTAVNKPMGYPSLIYGILVAQHPDIRRPDEIFEGPARYVVITSKL